MATGLKILITNNTLAERAGSELFVRDLAMALVRRGHSPMAYTSTPGAVADELRRATVPVVDDLSALNVVPDVIHAHHHLDAMCALIRFPLVPALYMCHGWLPWEEQPPVFPSIGRYVAVDDLCRERLETTPGVAANRIRTIYNGVDLRRFVRRTPLPHRPRAALIFSNYASESNIAGPIRQACLASGIERVDLVGRDSGASVPMPEIVLPNYDVVFAKARCALEAMAVGCAVIVADFSGLAGMVTPENVESLRRLNFGARTMQSEPLSVEGVRRELARYDVTRSGAVTAFIRSQADVEQSVDLLEAMYREIVAEGVGRSSSVEHACEAASVYLAGLSRTIKGRADAARRESVDATWNAQQLTVLSSDVQHIRGRLSAVQAQLDATGAELLAVRQSRTWRALALYRGARAWLRRP